MTRKETLKEVRKVIANGWCRGTMRRGHNYCLVGAIHKVVSEERSRDRIKRFLRGFTVPFGNNSLVLTAWNDIQKSKKPVLALLDKAIQRSR